MKKSIVFAISVLLASQSIFGIDFRSGIAAILQYLYLSPRATATTPLLDFDWQDQHYQDPDSQIIIFSTALPGKKFDKNNQNIRLFIQEGNFFREYRFHDQEQYNTVLTILKAKHRDYPNRSIFIYTFEDLFLNKIKEALNKPDHKIKLIFNYPGSKKATLLIWKPTNLGNREVILQKSLNKPQARAIEYLLEDLIAKKLTPKGKITILQQLPLKPNKSIYEE